LTRPRIFTQLFIGSTRH